jgi:hypothetical protein
MPHSHKERKRKLFKGGLQRGGEGERERGEKEEEVKVATEKAVSLGQLYRDRLQREQARHRWRQNKPENEKDHKIRTYCQVSIRPSRAIIQEKLREARFNCQNR